MTDIEDHIGYADLIDQAMRGVVRDALGIVGRDGLHGEHHCYITFNTRYPGVKIPDSLRNQYPEEMTIVLQHQFWNLTVDKHEISVELSFNHQREKLVVPLEALTAYADPSIKFGLQFRREYDDDDEILPARAGKVKAGVDDDDPTGLGSAEVISLDTFRNKD